MTTAIPLLLSPKVRSTNVRLLAGWLFGVIISGVVFTFVAGLLPESNPTMVHPIAGVIQLVLGILTFSMGWRQWTGRTSEGETVKLPSGWMDVESVSAVRAFALGFFLAAVNLKNISRVIAVGVAAGSAALAR